MNKLYIVTLILVFIAIEPQQAFKLITVQKNFTPAPSPNKLLEGVNDVLSTKLNAFNSVVGTLVQVKQNAKQNFVTSLTNKIASITMLKSRLISSATSSLSATNVAPIGAPHIITVRKVNPVVLTKTINVLEVLPVHSYKRWI